MKYHTIYADPPWMERGAGKIKRGADAHYPLMKNADILEMANFVQNLAKPDAHLYLWVTNNFLKIGLDVMAAWGFEYKTVVTWMKAEYVGQAHFDFADMETTWTSDQVGLGQYFRGVTEHCLFGTRGSLPYKQIDGKLAQGRTGFMAQRREHSRKPEEMRRMIELVSPGPYIELFARRPITGWDVWGNEV